MPPCGRGAKDERPDRPASETERYWLADRVQFGGELLRPSAGVAVIEVEGEVDAYTGLLRSLTLHATRDEAPADDGRGAAS